MGKKFSDEIDYIPDAIAWALDEDVRFLTRSLAALSGRNLIGIGSGGSSTAAAFIATLHESCFGLLSRSTTPGEFLAHQRPMENASGLLISAEGKNLDILAAADRIASFELPGLAIVLRPNTPLATKCRETGAATVASFQMPWGKDGYLATNSLIATMILVTRAYGIKGIEKIREVDRNWLMERRANLVDQGLSEHMASRKSLAVLYGTVGRIGAIDIESKLAESALGGCELTDYRQFAHGRHLQLAEVRSAPCFLAFHSANDKALCDSTLELFPREVPIIKVELPNDPILASLVSVIDAILITDILGQHQQRDPGQPVVSSFGRNIHALDVKKLLPLADSEQISLRRKLRCNVDQVYRTAAWTTAAIEFCERLRNANIKALACDFDGTFCDTDLRYEGLDERLISSIEDLARNGTIIGFASGRGDSLYDDLRKKLSSDTWSKIIIGYYSGSVIASLDSEKFEEPAGDPRFDDLEQWLKDVGIVANLETTPKNRGGQMSLRMQNFGAKHRAVAGIRHWIQRGNHNGWRVFCSGHSIDVITENVGKENVVRAIAHYANADPMTETLRIGDSGDLDGNDFELLDSGLGLSVDSVSPFPGTCWNLLPRGYKGVTGTLLYMNSLQRTDQGRCLSSTLMDGLSETLRKGGKQL
ncbi:HAD hydrolase family protein [Ferribacterium limneticum]|uniref:HAD hydrolase family protein n=1 Tax=Ferribacterium limneticum TaxID=76259 RepID=UPI001CF9234A|nr:HAD hydrolase family protein [Ferribacterium limneticum]UCV22575.1 HAD hydrolase family protein [Ferribacterium limneticum]